MSTDAVWEIVLLWLAIHALDVICFVALGMKYGATWADSKIRKVAWKPLGGLFCAVVYVLGRKP